MVATEQAVINLQWLRGVLKESSRRENARGDREFQRLCKSFLGTLEDSIEEGKAAMRLGLEDAMEAFRGESNIVSGPTILLQSGVYFNFLQPELCAISIEDIAHGLSQVCRFAGQAPEFYSVAQHCVHCSEIVPYQHAYAALMHDASEAVLRDVTRPLKQLLPDYRAVEARVEAALAKRFSIPNPLPPEVKAADIEMLAAEQVLVMNNRDRWDATQAAHGIEMPDAYHFYPTPWPPKVAKQRFLQRFAELTQ